jgi:hypothetical protein
VMVHSPPCTHRHKTHLPNCACQPNTSINNHASTIIRCCHRSLWLFREIYHPQAARCRSYRPHPDELDRSSQPFW